jgi:hypothetical protein
MPILWQPAAWKGIFNPAERRHPDPRRTVASATPLAAPLPGADKHSAAFQQKNGQLQHTKELPVKWSFSRRQSAGVCHTRERGVPMAGMRQERCQQVRGELLESIPMKNIFAAIVASTILISPAFAQNNQGNDNQRGNNQGGRYHPAPGPIAAAGLPVLAVGFGVYWLIRRRRKPE